MPRPNRRWQCSDRGRRRGNTSWQEAREPGERPPPGLRGRAIGLFYRDRNKGKKNKERIRNLEIPTGVEKRVKTLLQSIKHIAESQKVEIKQVSIQKYLSNKKIELDKVIDTSDGHHSNDDHMSLSENNATVNNIKEENQEFSSTVKIEMGQSYSEENIEAGFLPLSNKAITDKEGDKIFLNKECTQTGISVKLEVEDSTAVKTEPTEALGPDSLSPKDEDVFKRPLNKGPEPQPSSSTSADFIPFGNDILGAMEYGAGERRLSLRSTGEYKYGYYDIITGSFSEKLDECIANGVSINITSSNVTDESEYLLQEYNEMVQRVGYKKIMEFRKKLPTYKKSTELLEVIENNQVVVISGETGCGKSTQVPQIILDDAICKKRGANIKILVTQPRRIAASSLAARVSEERDEQMGNSVGYAVRLEKVEPRARGSIIYCTTGILLADLETNQGLTAYSHIILDEVHERDCHIDMSMMMLKQILKKRTDLKLILMSATIDADRLSAYFDNSPMMHIEGLAYPVEDVYLEDILKITNFQFLAFEPKRVQFRGHGRGNKIRRQNQRHEAGCMEELIQFRAKVGPWVESIKHTIPRSVYENLLNPKSEELTVNTDLILALITQICKMEHGAILVFVPGIAQISKILSKMQDSGMFPYPQFEIYPLHSKLPTLQQHKIFQKPPPGVRKIIVATNIAETSITIDDIVYVVDSGRMKLSGLNVEENVSTLATEWIAQANLRQRRGRAGRCQPGVCYHLMTSFRASQLAERVLPELQRSDLLEPVLMMKKLRLGAAGPALDHVPDPPAASTVKWAVEHLQQCGALDGSETLTPLGWHLARLPVHPAAGKLLLLGALFGVLDRAASVAAVWGFKDPFMMVIGKEDEANAAKKQLALGEPSDHIAISEAIITWEGLPRQERGAFAYAHFLSGDTLRLLSEMKQQLGRDLHQMGFLPSGSVKAPWENRNAHNLSLFKAVVAASLYPKIGTVRWKKMNARNPRKGPRHMTYTPEEGRVEVHPGSVLAVTYHHHTGARVVCDNPGASWLVYWLKQRSTKLYLIEVTMVYTLPLLFFGELRICDAEDGNPDECIISITSIKVRCNRQTAQLLFELRCLLDQVLASKVTVYSEHAYRSNDFEEYVLNAVTELITAEDEQVDYSSDDNDFSDQSDCESSQRNYNWTNE